jgi:hypothetical protein
VEESIDAFRQVRIKIEFAEYRYRFFGGRVLQWPSASREACRTPMASERISVMIVARHPVVKKMFPPKSF